MKYIIIFFAALILFSCKSKKQEAEKFLRVVPADSVYIVDTPTAWRRIHIDDDSNSTTLWDEDQSREWIVKGLEHKAWLKWYRDCLARDVEINRQMIEALRNPLLTDADKIDILFTAYQQLASNWHNSPIPPDR